METLDVSNKTLKNQFENIFQFPSAFERAEWVRVVVMKMN